jgi:hypothetical protein
MKKIFALLFILAAACFAQTAQVIPETGNAGFFSTPWCVQWYDTTFTMWDDTLQCANGNTRVSKPFRMYPYMGGELVLTGADSIRIKCVELWASTSLDTTTFTKAKPLYFSRRHFASYDTTMTVADRYGCDFATGGAWKPARYGQIRVKFNVGQKKIATNTLRFTVQGWGDRP